MRYADSHCRYVESFEGAKNFYTFTGKCVVTGKDYSVKVPGDRLYQYRQGMSIQNAFPDMPAEDREFLISGMSPEGWDLHLSQCREDDE